MCPTEYIGMELQTWNNAIDAARGLISNTVATVKEGTSIARFPLPVRFWHAAKQLKSLVQSARDVRAKIQATPASFYETGEASAITPHLHTMIEKMFDLNSSIGELYTLAKRRGYTNRTLTAASLNRIKAYGEELFNEAENTALIIDSRTEERFRAAREEFERGECVGMEIFS